MHSTKTTHYEAIDTKIKRLSFLITSMKLLTILKKHGKHLVTLVIDRGLEIS